MIRAVVLCLLVFSMQLAAGQVQSDYRVPQRLAIFAGSALADDGSDWIPDATVEPSGNSHEVATMYPIGWSQRGKLAYVHHPITGESGENPFCLVLVDLNSDSILHNELLGETTLAVLVPLALQ